MTHLLSQKPHVLGYKTYNYTLRVGRREIAAEYDKVSAITVALA
jgi:hypothetical protein